jgi:branched-chain amino acid transport system ATP-binding protein
MDDVALRLDEVRVEFGGVKAVDGASLTVRRGGLHAVIGPNGSGKTTLLNATSGFVRAQGSVVLLGREVGHVPSYSRARRGLGRTFQNPHGDHTLTVRDLLRVGAHVSGPLPWWTAALAPRRFDRGCTDGDRCATALLRRVGLSPNLLDARLVDLSAGVAKLVDVARALNGRPQVLLLDEPTSGMNAEEIQTLGSALREMRDNDDLTVLLVEHNLEFVADVCDIVTVMAAGAVLAVGELHQVLDQPEVVEAYFGGSAPPSRGSELV